MLMPFFCPSAQVDFLFADAYDEAVIDTGKTFNSVNFGPAASDRLIVVCSYSSGGSAPTFSSFTIGGVSATQLADITNTGHRATIWGALVPSGTSGTVSYTLSAGSFSAISVYAITGIDSLTPDATATGTGASIDLSLNVQAGDIVIATGTGIDGTASCTWTGLTEDRDTSLNQGGRLHNFTSASYKALSSATPMTITCAMTSSNYRCACAALWRV